MVTLMTINSTKECQIEIFKNAFQCKCCKPNAKIVEILSVKVESESSAFEARGAYAQART